MVKFSVLANNVRFEVDSVKREFSRRAPKRG